LIIQAVGLAIVIFIAWYIIKRSALYAKRLSEGEEEDAQNEVITWSRREVLHTAVVVLCLFFLVQLFTSFVGSIYSVFLGFFDKYSGDNYPEHLWLIILYASLFFVLRHSWRTTDWLIQKVLGESKSVEQEE
jgi:hypothetical protein